MLGITAQQCAELAAAGVLGPTYTVRAGKQESARRFYSEDRIAELAAAPHLDKATVQRIAGAHGYERVVVLRQSSAVPLGMEAHDQRDWYGVDYSAIHSGDPALVAMQEEATRRWWEISNANVVAFTRMQQTGGRAMLISSLSGLVVLCRDITGLDLTLNIRSSKYAYDISPAGDWENEILGHWVDSGRGRAMLTWDPLGS